MLEESVVGKGDSMSDFNPLSSLTGLTSLTARLRVPRPHNPAESMYERIVRSIAEFEEGLDESQEIGLRLVNFGSETFHIEDVGFWGMDLLKFYGRNSQGKPIELLQHISQISILLVAVP